MDARPEVDSDTGEGNPGHPPAGGDTARFDWRKAVPGRNIGVKATGQRLSKPKPVTILCGALALIWLFIGGWYLVGSDRFGGEPIAIASITPAAEGGTSVAGNDAAQGAGSQTSTALGDPTLQVTRSNEDGAGIIRVSDPLAQQLYDETLVERTRYGMLPIIAESGRRSFQAYAGQVPEGSADKPRIALILTGMGLSAASTDAAIRNLPAGVTMAFAPYGRDLGRLVAAARRDGHEVMLQVPLEPFDYPDNDPGPHTLLTSIPERQNIDRLHWVMGRINGYVGVINHMGARFSSDAEALRPFLEEIRNRGLVYVDDGAISQSKAEDVAETIGMPAELADIIIDADPNRSRIDDALDGLVEIARERGHAIGVASGLPSTLQALRPWVEEIEARGIVLVPVTAMIDIGGT
ncbi:MAG: divergent polysaccharide deacetylase family protein [Pseudomonadota bacterium]